MTLRLIARSKILAVPALLVFFLHTLPLDAQNREQAVLGMSDRVFTTMEAAQSLSFVEGELKRLKAFRVGTSRIEK
ncbi:MAG: hypothetical protein ABR612_11935 [Chromatocurvus sp.]